MVVFRKYLVKIVYNKCMQNFQIYSFSVENLLWKQDALKKK